VLTILVYFGAKQLYRRFKTVLFSPLLVVPLVMISLLWVTAVPYATYATGTSVLSALLGPSVVAFAVPIYKNMRLIKQHGVEIGLSVVLGSAVALFSSVAMALWLRLSPETAESLAPRSVTTPVAMDISRSIGGLPPLTAAFVMVTALVGILIGPPLVRWLRLRTAVARGALFGMGAHGAGTARAFEFGQVEGTVSSLAMIGAAGATLVLTPLLLPLLLRIHP
jgi:predicted murein hydrolase (TIGR00659 family)